MSFQSHIVRTSVVLVVLTAAFAWPAPSHAMPADARNSDPKPVNARGTDVAAVDQQDLRSPDAEDAARPKTPSDVTAALAKERYYSTYGENVEPPTSSMPLADTRDNGIAPLPFVISLLGALIVGATGASAVSGLRRRRGARVAT